MNNFIDGVDFYNLEVQKYWSFPKSYKGDPKTETKNMIFSGDYVGAEKIDGALYIFVKDEDGNMGLYGRSRGVDGEFSQKIEWVPHLHEFFNSLPNGTCLLGEIYLPSKPGSRYVTTIMGCLVDKAIARQETEKLHYYVFDILAWDGENLLKRNIENRLDYLEKEIREEIIVSFEDYVEVANYYEGKELWTVLQTALSRGGEGIVITKKGTCYQPGKRPARQTLKIKKEIQNTIDCFFTGRASAPTRLYTGKEIESWMYWEDISTGEKILGNKFKEYSKGLPYEPVTKPYYFNWAGSLEIGLVKNNMIVPIGTISGVTDEIKADWKKYEKQVIEVAAMEIFSDTKALRHAKMIQFRPDKTWKECSWEQLEG